MSLTVATCRCGRHWYRFDRLAWDGAVKLHWCPECRLDDGFSNYSKVAPWRLLEETAEVPA